MQSLSSEAPGFQTGGLTSASWVSGVLVHLSGLAPALSQRHNPSGFDSLGAHASSRKGSSVARDRRKNQPSPGGIAAHDANWGLIGEVKPHGSSSYVSSWRCTVCSRTATNTSPQEGAMPAPERHPATK